MTYISKNNGVAILFLTHCKLSHGQHDIPHITSPCVKEYILLVTKFKACRVHLKYINEKSGNFGRYLDVIRCYPLVSKTGSVFRDISGCVMNPVGYRLVATSLLVPTFPPVDILVQWQRLLSWSNTDFIFIMRTN